MQAVYSLQEAWYSACRKISDSMQLLVLHCQTAGTAAVGCCDSYPLAPNAAAALVLLLQC
jgi:hypothetical protein